jgi:thioredoxin 1
MSEKNITSVDQFEKEVINSELPSMVDFWAPWCAPCQMISPAVEELSKEYEGKVNVVKVNIDEAKELSGKYGVMSIPNLLFFKGGDQVDQVIGSVEKDKLKDIIDNKLL